jgi:hypothetical protein
LRAAAFLPLEIASLAGSLSITSFNRLQLELPDCGLAHGFTPVHRPCDKNSGYFTWVNLHNHARVCVTIATWHFYLAVPACPFLGDRVGLLYGRLREGSGVLAAEAQG